MKIKKAKKSDNDLEIIDLDKVDEIIDTNTKDIGTLSKYISTTYMWVHLITLLIYTIVLMTAVTFINQRYLWHIFMTGSIVFMILLYGIYIACKKHKQKKDKLSVHKIKFIWQTLYMILSIVWMCVISMICGLAQVMLIFK